SVPCPRRAPETEFSRGGRSSPRWPLDRHCPQRRRHPARIYGTSSRHTRRPSTPLYPKARSFCPGPFPTVGSRFLKSPVFSRRDVFFRHYYSTFSDHYCKDKLANLGGCRQKNKKWVFDISRGDYHI